MGNPSSHAISKCICTRGWTKFKAMMSTIYFKICCVLIAEYLMKQPKQNQEGRMRRSCDLASVWGTKTSRVPCAIRNAAGGCAWGKCCRSSTAPQRSSAWARLAKELLRRCRTTWCTGEARAKISGPSWSLNPSMMFLKMNNLLTWP